VSREVGRQRRGTRSEGSTPSIPTLREARYSQSLERGLAVLAHFSAERPSLAIADIADELRMSRSTTHRYASTLVMLGYLEQDASRRYRLGLRSGDLGLLALDCTGVRQRSRLCVEELRIQTRHTVCLAMLDRGHVVLVEVARGLRCGQYRIDDVFAIGVRLPAHCTAFGKLLLAHAYGEQTLKGLTLARRGPKTITSRRLLAAELKRVRQEGLAYSDRELGPELISIAAPVRDESGAVCATLGIAAHTSMGSMMELVEQSVGNLKASADELSELLLGKKADRPERST
jgi:IclR family pca regulon transcriptional regulator